MSRRLQILLPQQEYKQVSALCRKMSKTVSEWVREGIRERLIQSKPMPAGQRLARILKFARMSGPTGSIERILEEIEQGRDQK